jgi:hypothetical protein
MAVRRLQAMDHVTCLFGAIDTRSLLSSTLPVHRMIRKHSYEAEFSYWSIISGGFSRSRGRNEQDRDGEGIPMNFSAFQRFQLTIILALIGTVTLPALANAYTEEQQRLCNDDAMRLCSEDVPDVERTTACMQRHRALLSKECKSVFGGRRHFPIQRGPDRRQQ